jgi:beta-galactosidase GanA
MTEITRPFTLKGRPFYPIGGQTRNSSGYNPQEWETALRALRLMHGNTLEIPVYWEQVEPEEGVYHFSHLEELLRDAESHDIRLVLLWFGTWKNGNMEYVPDWVKTDRDRFKRVLSPTGHDLWVLSSHCEATFEADRRAFTAFCQSLKEVDQEQRVIAVQIENEPGILGSDRDYGAVAQAEFEATIPGEVIAGLQALEGGPLYKVWQAAGGVTSGAWPTVFGDAAGEIMTAWSIGRYIDRLAEAGKAIYDLPMYANVWLGETGWQIPGENYPSGGAVTKVLDLVKWASPHIDLIAPDIYLGDARSYEAVCAAYARDDNPLFVPESAPGGSNPLRIFRAIGDYDAIGYAFFAIEDIVGEDGEVRPELRPLVDSFRCVATAVPLLLEH